jgi:energy-coupling factor transporter ATP-binding protein EcfA2
MYTKLNDGKLLFTRLTGHQIDKIPGGIYTLFYNQRDNTFGIETTEEFKKPIKLYGKTDQIADRIITTFEDRNQTTGVLLSGLKGSGKSLLVKIIAQKLLEKQIPTIIINDPRIDAEELAYFLNKMNQPAFIVFDEFDKNYREIQLQEKLLSILDGVNSPLKKLFAVVINDESKLSNFLINRPGRLYYYHKFTTLDFQVVEDYCKKELKNQEHFDSVLKFFDFYSMINFDMLKALVEEMNRYNEPAQDAAKYLNIRIDNGIYNNYTVKVYDANDEPVQTSVDRFQYRPFYNPDGFVIRTLRSQDEKQVFLEISEKDLVEYNRAMKKLIYRRNGYRVELTQSDSFDSTDFSF